MDMLLILMMVLHIVKTKAEVRLQLPSGMIEIGKDLKLTCKSSIEMSANRSRQWRGGVRNKLLCYDGITIDPHKYREDMKNRSDYELTVKRISESDLQCPYACQIGFDQDQKILNVTEQNFLHMPEQNVSNLNYQQINGNYTIRFEIQKVYPKPSCKAISNGVYRNITVTNETKSHVLLNVSYKLETEDPLHRCLKPITIDCLIGEKTHTITVEHSFICENLQTDSYMGTVYVVMAVIFIAILLISIVLVLLHVYRKSINACQKWYSEVRTDDLKI